MKNVLIISTTNGFSGAEQVLFDYLKNNNGHKFYIYTSDIVKDITDHIVDIHAVTILSSDDMRVRSIRRRPIASLFYIFRNLFMIHKIVREKQIDILYGNNTMDMVYVMLYRCFFRRSISTICHIHDIIERAMYHHMIRRFEKYVDAFITPSFAGKRSFAGDVADSDKIHVVYNGVISVSSDGRSMLEDNTSYNKPKKLLFVGFICERKRVDLFIQLVEKLNEAYPKAYRGIIVGDMQENLRYQEKFQSWLTSESVTYLGHVEHTILCSKVFPQADALVLVSDRDPLPTVILEAMAANVLVCARAVDGVPEMIENGVDGVLWEHDASIERMADVVHMTLCDDVKVNKLKKNALKKLQEKFDPEKKKEIINSLIDRV